MIYEKERKSAVDLEIGAIKKALIYFANQVKNGKNWKAKQCREQKKEIIERVRKLKSRDSTRHLQRVKISDFDDEEFYGLRGDFEQKRKSAKRICQKQRVEMNLLSGLTGDKDGRKRTQTWQKERKN